MVFFMLLALPLLKQGTLSLGEFFAYSFVREIFTSYITKIFYAILQKNQLHVIDIRARDLFPAGQSTPPEKRSSIPTAPPTFTQKLVYQNIRFAYDASQPVLRDLSLSLTRGQSVAIIGESGAGKSTLLKVMAGLMPPQQGQVLVDGETVDFNKHMLCSFCKVRKTFCLMHRYYKTSLCLMGIWIPISTNVSNAHCKGCN